MEKVNSHTTMSEAGKSDESIVPKRQMNKGRSNPAESVEGRDSTKRNTQQDAGSPTQSGTRAMFGLERVRQVAADNRRVQFTSLYHYLSKELLWSSFYRLSRRAAPGVDGLSWTAYEEGLEARLIQLANQLRNGTYRPRPARRIYIPKADGTQRPLSILCVEDKIVQQATVTVLEHIYEKDFLGFSYGFRPGRGQHDALDALYVGITKRKVNWVLDLDLRRFFDQVEHDWLIKFIQHRIKDKRLIRLLTQWMKVGHYDEDGKHIRSARGVPQGGVISPLLANIYLHYCLDLWVNQWRKHPSRGDVISVRYADDAVLGFQRKDEADDFLKLLQTRLAKFGLELNNDKTKLIRFGRFARRAHKEFGYGKPQSFDFLGFTHSCGVKRSGNEFFLLRQTAKSRMRSTLQKVKVWLHKNRHKPIPEQVVWLTRVLRGHFNYFGVPGNAMRIGRFRSEVGKYWLKSLRRRSQRFKLVWEKFGRFFNTTMPKVKVLHPYPNQRFGAKYSR